MSFIIAKISWHFQYHKGSRKFVVVCVNCLRSSSHASSTCTSGQCKVCQTKHNTLFHMSSAADPSTINTDKEVAPKAIPPPSLLSNYTLESSNNEQAMLSIAVVLICGSDGSRVKPCWIMDRKRTS